mmetsp:Transcript_7909/g.29272  ORF Transcript_7909/g.29272 Transcript_7909/m.29272 type:complete len:83 (+) Transcript_7909:392-640(+)
MADGEAQQGRRRVRVLLAATGSVAGVKVPSLLEQLLPHYEVKVGCHHRRANGGRGLTLGAGGARTGRALEQVAVRVVVRRRR